LEGGREKAEAGQAAHNLGPILGFFIPTILPAQLADVVRIGQETDVEDKIGVERQAVFEPERGDVDHQPLAQGKLLNHRAGHEGVGSFPLIVVAGVA